MGIPFVKAFSYIGASATAAQTINLGFAPSALIVYCDGATRNQWMWTSGITSEVFVIGPTLVGVGGGQLTASTSTVSMTLTTATLGFNLPAGFDQVNGANMKYYGIAFSNEQ